MVTSKQWWTVVLINGGAGLFNLVVLFINWGTGLWFLNLAGFLVSSGVVGWYLNIARRYHRERRDEA